MNFIHLDKCDTRWKCLHKSTWLPMFSSLITFKDWSLVIMGRGKGYKTGGGASEVLPLRIGGGGKSFSRTKGGAQKVLG